MRKILSLMLIVGLCINVVGCSNKLSEKDIEIINDQIEIIYEMEKEVTLSAALIYSMCYKYEDKIPYGDKNIVLLYDFITDMVKSSENDIKVMNDLDLDLIDKYLNNYNNDIDKREYDGKVENIYRYISYSMGVSDILNDGKIDINEVKQVEDTFMLIAYPRYENEEIYDTDKINLRNRYDEKYEFK
ncbi:MAG: hypothetical protein ACRCWM_08085 [Sarcina sp.]|uniref:hypothetical protein n=1 Tax=Clostridium sp. TaxID=1506 RepID=UPI003EE6587D